MPRRPWICESAAAAAANAAPCGGIHGSGAAIGAACCELRLRGRAAIGLDLGGGRADPADQRVLQLVHGHRQRHAGRRHRQQERKRQRMGLRQRREAGGPACVVILVVWAIDLFADNIDLPVPASLVALVLGGLALLIVVIKFFSKPGSDISSFGGTVHFSVSVAWGLYVAILASIAVVVRAYMQMTSPAPSSTSSPVATPPAAPTRTSLG